MANRVGGTDLDAITGIEWVPVPGSSIRLAVTTGEQDMGAMTADRLYLFTCTADCYYKQGTAPIAASAGNGSGLYVRGQKQIIDARDGLILSVIGLTAGDATLQEVKALR